MNGPSFFSRRDVGQDDPPLARLARGHLLLLRLLPRLALGAAWFTFMYKKTPGETRSKSPRPYGLHAAKDLTRREPVTGTGAARGGQLQEPPLHASAKPCRVSPAVLAGQLDEPLVNTAVPTPEPH